MKGKIRIQMDTELEITSSGLECPDFFYEEHRCVDDILEDLIKSAGKSCNCHRNIKITWLGWMDDASKTST